ncbi:MAG: MarR family winged helix-turn-helix transcriptional regulator [Xanthomonadales bacterium]|nr:MarR family winged helix-turn-helix transcriptional regulator [Xanthomonadales bacterium]
MDELVADRDALHLERFLPFRLTQLANRTSDALFGIYSRIHELTVTEWRILAILGRFPDSSARRVAERGALDKVAVSRAVARMLERGILTRDMAEDDRRRSVLNLSDTGWEIYAEIAPAALAFEAELLGGLDPSERKALVSIIEKLSARLDRFDSRRSG